MEKIQVLDVNGSFIGWVGKAQAGKITSNRNNKAKYVNKFTIQYQQDRPHGNFHPRYGGKSKLIASYSLDYILDMIQEQVDTFEYWQDKSILLPTGNSVKISISMRAFEHYRNNLCCSSCGVQAHHFLELMIKNKMCFNLLTKDYILLVADHSVPKSIGGAGILPNLKVMCEFCNCEKNDKLLYETVKLYRVTSCKDMIKSKYSDHEKLQEYLDFHVNDMYNRLEKHNKGDLYGFVTFEELVDYIGMVAKKFGLVIDPNEINYSLFPKSGDQL